jgi:hypothetical protein
MDRSGISSAQKSRLGAPRLLSTIDGEIKNLLFSFPSWIYERALYEPAERRFIDGYLDVVKAIMRTATARMSFTILIHASAAGLLKEWLVRNGIRAKVRLVDCPDDLRFTVWSNDMFLVGEDHAGRHSYGLVPPQFPRAGDGMVAELLARSGCFALRRSPLFFQGGNILVGDDFLLIGADDLRRSLRKGGIARRDDEPAGAAVKRALRLRLDRSRTAHVIAARTRVHRQEMRAVRNRGRKWTEMLYFGNFAGTRQPLFHIDMFISLVGRAESGRFKLLVGDPRMAGAMVGSAGWPDSMPEAFDDIALQLSQRGFEIERNPLPLAYYDNHRTRERVWYFATYNNVIVQGDPPIVWLPSYGHGRWKKFTRTDAANRAIWERNDYEVRLLPNCHPIAMRHGGALCIAKCLA